MKVLIGIIFIILRFSEIFAVDSDPTPAMEFSFLKLIDSNELIDCLKDSNDIEKLIEIKEKYKYGGEKNKNYYPLIFVACAHGDEESVKVLAKYGANMDSAKRSYHEPSLNLMQMLLTSPMHWGASNYYCLPQLPIYSRMKMFSVVQSLGASYSDGHLPLLENIAYNFHTAGDGAVKLLKEAINRGASTRGTLDFFTSSLFEHSPDNFQNRAIQLLIENGATWSC